MGRVLIYAFILQIAMTLLMIFVLDAPKWACVVFPAALSIEYIQTMIILHALGRDVNKPGRLL